MINSWRNDEMTRQNAGTSTKLAPHSSWLSPEAFMREQKRIFSPPCPRVIEASLRLVLPDTAENCR
jgi:hypothetical protein